MTGHSFLYVEDDPMSREIFGILLKNVMGYQQVTIFEDSINFIERVKALPIIPTVVFLDIQMLPHDGYEMLKMLRHHQEYEDTKIVALTASVMAIDINNLQQAGFFSLISKPVKQRTFPVLLNDILAGQSVWKVT